MGGLIANVRAFDVGAAERVRVHFREDKHGGSSGEGSTGAWQTTALYNKHLKSMYLI